MVRAVRHAAKVVPVACAVESKDLMNRYGTVFAKTLASYLTNDKPAVLLQRSARHATQPLNHWQDYSEVGRVNIISGIDQNDSPGRIKIHVEHSRFA